MQKYSIFVGIDISKKWFDAALCINGDLKKLPHRRFPQTLKGYQALLDWTSKNARRQNLQGKWLFCMEHTGMYALNICQFFDEQSQNYVLESPLRMNRSLGLRRGKNDKADSRAIAKYAYRFQNELRQRRALPNLLLLKVQALLSLRARLVRYRQGLLSASGELNACVKPAISQPVVIQTDRVTRTINKTIEDVMNQIEELIRSEKHLAKLYDLVISVSGIGPVITPYLLVHTNGFTAFESSRKFCSYIGIVPFDYQSGTSINWDPEVSPIACKKLKVLLTTAAITAIRCDSQINAFFQRQLKRGKDPAWIYNAIKNKVVHRIFKVVKRGTPYVKLEH